MALDHSGMIKSDALPNIVRAQLDSFSSIKLGRTPAQVLTAEEFTFLCRANDHGPIADDSDVAVQLIRKGFLVCQYTDGLWVVKISPAGGSVVLVHRRNKNTQTAPAV